MYNVTTSYLGKIYTHTSVAPCKCVVCIVLVPAFRNVALVGNLHPSDLNHQKFRLPSLEDDVATSTHCATLRIFLIHVGAYVYQLSIAFISRLLGYYFEIDAAGSN